MTFSLHGTLQSFFIGVSLCYVTSGCHDETLMEGRVDCQSCWLCFDNQL